MKSIYEKALAKHGFVRVLSAAGCITDLAGQRASSARTLVKVLKWAENEGWYD